MSGGEELLIFDQIFDKILLTRTSIPRQLTVPSPLPLFYIEVGILGKASIRLLVALIRVLRFLIRVP